MDDDRVGGMRAPRAAFKQRKEEIAVLAPGRREAPVEAVGRGEGVAPVEAVGGDELGRGEAPATLARLQHGLVSKALALGFDDTFRVMVGAAIAGAVIGVALRRNGAVRAVAEPVGSAAAVEPCEVMAS